jgi:hypothetical protein
MSTGNTTASGASPITRFSVRHLHSFYTSSLTRDNGVAASTTTHGGATLGYVRDASLTTEAQR